MYPRSVLIPFFLLVLSLSMFIELPLFLALWLGFLGKQWVVFLMLCLKGLPESELNYICHSPLSSQCTHPPIPLHPHPRQCLHPWSCTASCSLLLPLYHAVIASIPRKDILIVLGDFSARIGLSSPHWKSIVGPFTPDYTNENGSLLLDVCASNNLFIANIWFQHKPVHLTTWYRSGDRSHTGHMLDYVLVNCNFRTSVLDTRVYRSTYLKSNHDW